jgi:hypothetical protein
MSLFASTDWRARSTAASARGRLGLLAHSFQHSVEVVTHPPKEGYFMNTNDARIARIYTAAPAGVTEDETPNAGPPRTDAFDLILQLEAGNAAGSGGGNYTLTFTAINDDTVAPEAGLNPTGNPFNEQFLAPDWKPSGNDFARTSPALAAVPATATAPAIPATPEIIGIARYRITILAGTTGQFHYNVRLVALGGQIVGFGRSNPFLLV